MLPIIQGLENFRLQLNAILADIAGWRGDRILLPGVSANTTITVAAGWELMEVHVFNTTANAVAGGLNIGTTNGASDVVAGLAVPGAALTKAPVAQVFSTLSDQVLYISAATSWNAASLTLSCLLRKVF